MVSVNAGVPRSMRRVTAREVINPIVRGRSRPIVVEADDGARYVVKFRKDPKFTRMIIAEAIVGFLARAVGFATPEVVAVSLDPDIVRPELPDRHTENLEQSWGLNVGFAFLPNSSQYTPAVAPPMSREQVAQIVLFDAFCMNDDRRRGNPNLLMYREMLWLIDHDSALGIHHAWATPRHRRRLNSSNHLPADSNNFLDHALLPYASSIVEQTDFLRKRLSEELIQSAVDVIPEEWLERGFPDGSLTDPRRDYMELLSQRYVVCDAVAVDMEAYRLHGICLEPKARLRALAAGKGVTLYPSPRRATRLKRV